MYDMLGSAAHSILDALGLKITELGGTFVSFITTIADRLRFVFDNWRDYLRLMRAHSILAMQNTWELSKTWAINSVEILQWTAKNWITILQVVIDLHAKAFTNLWDNIKTGWKATIAFLHGDEIEIKWTPLTKGFKDALKELNDLPKLTKASIKSSTVEIDALNDKLRQKWRDFQTTKNVPVIITPNKSFSTGWQIKGEMKLPTASTGSPFVGIADLAKQSQEASLKRIQERQLAELQKNVNVLLQFYDLARNTGIKLASGAPAVFQ
jgi:hypothetical protein